MKKALYGNNRRKFSVFQKIDMRLWFLAPQILCSSSAKIFIPREFFGKNKEYVSDRYAGLPFLTKEQGNQCISDIIKSGKPSLIGRFGDTELFACGDFSIRHKMAAQNLHRLCVNSGFFYNDASQIGKFVEVFTKAFSNSDVVGCWFTIGEDYMIKKYTPQTTLIPLESIEPYYYQDPWSSSLAGKKVLIVSPYSDTITAQYKKHKLLFPNTEILPSFDLITVKSVLTRGSLKDDRFSTWFDALNYMTDEIAKKEFDVAIVGCGAYSLPLCSEIKKMGKIGVQMGGATQILFGIMGNRWQNNPSIQKYCNPSWTRLSKDENPTKANEADDPYS